MDIYQSPMLMSSLFYKVFSDNTDPSLRLFSVLDEFLLMGKGTVHFKKYMNV